MYFKRLELIGFKSFAEKTVLNFDDGVTAVVGPNGCGKSNISDAIRWALGEQSAKSLRGSSMEDVIFNGSAVVDPVNFAEVSLVLSNEQKILPIEYAEVTISRRLYRSGESEYLINKNPVRLRDVQELLMGTGIGTECYSIIEQGKMDQILNSKPEDRRIIFEEAAGITKFKTKKKEALRKLDETDANLVRVNDIVAEVKRQITSIERQAKKAESYKLDFEKLKKLDLGVTSKEYLTLAQNKQSKENALHVIKEEEAQFFEEVNALKSEMDTRRAELDGLDQDLREVRLKELELKTEISKKQDRVFLNRERILELGERTAQRGQQMELSRRRIEELGAELQAMTEEYEGSKREEEECRQFLETAQQEFSKIEYELRALLESEGSAKGAISTSAQARSKAQGELSRFGAELHALEETLGRFQREEEALRREEDEMGSGLKAFLKEDTPETLLLRSSLQANVAEFKKTLKNFLQRFLGRPSADFTPQDEQELETEIGHLSGAIWEAQSDLVAKQGKRISMEERKKKLNEERSFLAAEMARLETSREDFAKKKEEAGVQFEALSATINRSSSELTDLERRWNERSQEKETLLVKLTEARSKQNYFTARREKIERDRNWVLESKTNESSQGALYEKEKEACSQKKASLEEETACLEEEIRSAAQEKDTLLGETGAFAARREGAARALEQVEAARRRKTEFLEGVLTQVHKLDLEMTEIRYEIDRARDRVLNQYQADLASDAATYAQAELDVEYARSEIENLKARLQRLGPVNLVAIEEFEEFKARLDFLTQQEQDLLKSKEDLHKAITKINQTTRLLFTETFARIQEYFSLYFKELFGGGSAELVMLDSQDVLETGIEIIARPPGKKNQTVMLLSGGEKSLAAIALLFALFKVKPSPFCVLDEIDAALDEANVERFSSTLKTFIQGSQFIVITHNKRTMNLADALYGITMAESGTTKIVSVKFNNRSDSVQPQEISQKN